jgi:alpha-tubulin suppressor-like RCC1 family protein
MTNDTLRCWGDQNHLLGTGEPYAVVETPRPVKNASGTGPLQGVEDASVGGYHICALLESTEVRCWGENNRGQVGNGTTTDAKFPRTVRTGPTTRLDHVTQLAAGGLHTCALSDVGEVWCWGRNRQGQLGLDDIEDRLYATQVLDPTGTAPLDGVEDIVAGNNYTCARTVDTEAYCWGYNTYGQLGDGTFEDSLLPTPVMIGLTPLSDIVQISTVAVSEHTCARDDVGRVRCWGRNGEGQLGRGGTADSPIPGLVHAVSGAGPLTEVAEVAVGWSHTCAVITDHTARCWGWNLVGQLANLHSDSESHRPVIVRTANGQVATNLSSAAGNRYNSCFRKPMGYGVCAGSDDFGGLGDGPTSPDDGVRSFVKPIVS